MVTAEMLRAARMKLSLHVSLDAGGFVYRYQCVEYPDLVVEEARANRNQPIRINAVVGEEEFPYTLEAAAAALNRYFAGKQAENDPG